MDISASYGADIGGRGEYGRGSLYTTSVCGKTVYRSAKIVSSHDGFRKKVIGTGASASQALAGVEANIEKFQAGPIAKAEPRKVAPSSDRPDEDLTFVAVAYEWLSWR